MRGSDGRALRNVEVAGRPVGGLASEALDSVIAELAAEYLDTTVRIETPDGAIRSTGAEIGLSLDQDRTRALVLAEGRQGPLLERFGEWAASLVAPRPADVAVALDGEVVKTVVVSRDPTGRVAPTEPTVVAVDGELVVVEGVPGAGLDPGAVAASIEEEAASGHAPIVVEADVAPIPPRFADADAERLAERGRQLTAEPLPVQAGDSAAVAHPETLTGWLTTKPTEAGLELVVDRDETLADLEALLSEAGEPAVDASFLVRGGEVVITPSAEGTRCCAPAAADVAFTALADRPEGSVVLPLAPREPERTTVEAEALGIVQPVASYTTHFEAGQSRVTNIHRIADITRGAVIEPGGELSLNGFVGRRTTARGFVPGGVIQNGMFDESVGGGISQYATTLFNAAFFGGLEFGDYQSHSIYISRYPYGREATVSFPQPDLVIENPTPYGVLVWPTHTPTSLTVNLYSTPWAYGAQTGQRETDVGNCTRVVTQRTRTFLSDGHTETDAVYATYRPAEGVNC